MERLEQGIPLTPPPMSSAFPYKDEDGPVLTGRGGERPGIYLVNSLILVDWSLSEDIHFPVTLLESEFLFQVHMWCGRSRYSRILFV